jgi:hypothetical protein
VHVDLFGLNGVDPVLGNIVLGVEPGFLSQVLFRALAMATKVAVLGANDSIGSLRSVPGTFLAGTGLAYPLGCSTALGMLSGCSGLEGRYNDCRGSQSHGLRAPLL